ncbi:MAG: MBL fold metallo-hydrolase [Alphaproteobacteria bacterium]|nr:MBL fold metallo-hydrolase [Alphaproteobacteria bacterium]
MGIGRIAALLVALVAVPTSAAPSGYTLIPGSFPSGRQPDGNSIVIDAPAGLIVVDTGRHPQHREKILAYAKSRGRPIAAIVNSHWHLDHTGGNAALRRAFPRADVYASRAVEGALTGFLARSRKDAEAFLASGRASPQQAAEMRGDFATMDDRAALMPTVPVVRSQRRRVAGRLLHVNLARHAATEGDVWLYDSEARAVVAGDLVVAAVPFLDTACPDGWRKALGDIARTPFTTLFPGHGAPMTHGQFDLWRRAFDNLLDCSASARADDDCKAGWMRDAAPFVAAEDTGRVEGLLDYYLKTRLRSPAGRREYCAG